jgi:DnaJ like chaperone protein
MPFLKFLAAFFGLIYLGLPGAILGWFAGSMISTLITDGPRALLPGGRREIHERRQTLFLKTLFLLMGQLAKADSRVTQSEIDYVEQFMTKMGMTAEHRKQAIVHFQQGTKSGFEFDATLDDFFEVCGRSLQMKHLLLVYLAGVAMADGEMDEAENELLASIAVKLGYSQQAFKQLMAMIQGQNRFGGDYGHQQYRQAGGSAPRGATHTLEDAYQALGVSASSSDKEVKRAYRKLISQYHPDKLIGQGVPEDMIKAATERSKEIHAAHDLIEKHRKNP